MEYSNFIPPFHQWSITPNPYPPSINPYPGYYYPSSNPPFSTFTPYIPYHQQPIISAPPQPQDFFSQPEIVHELETLKQYLIETHEIKNKFREELKEQIQNISNSLKMSQEKWKEKYVLRNPTVTTPLSLSTALNTNPRIRDSMAKASKQQAPSDEEFSNSSSSSEEEQVNEQINEEEDEEELEAVARAASSDDDEDDDGLRDEFDVDGSFGGGQTYYTHPNYQDPASSPSYVPLIQPDLVSIPPPPLVPPWLHRSVYPKQRKSPPSAKVNNLPPYFQFEHKNLIGIQSHNTPTSDSRIPGVYVLTCSSYAYPNVMSSCEVHSLFVKMPNPCDFFCDTFTSLLSMMEIPACFGQVYRETSNYVASSIWCHNNHDCRNCSPSSGLVLEFGLISSVGSSSLPYDLTVNFACIRLNDPPVKVKQESLKCPGRIDVALRGFFTDTVLLVFFDGGNVFRTKELEAEVVNVTGTAKPSRKIRSEQDKEPEQETVSEVAGPGPAEESGSEVSEFASEIDDEVMSVTAPNEVMPVTAPNGDRVYTKLDRYYGEDQATNLNSGEFSSDLALEPISVLFERLDEKTFVKILEASSESQSVVDVPETLTVHDTCSLGSAKHNETLNWNRGSPGCNGEHIVAANQFNHGVFHDVADFAIPTKPPDFNLDYANYVMPPPAPTTMYRKSDLEYYRRRYFLELKDDYYHKVQISDSTFRCPFCFNKDYYSFTDLLRHASKIAADSHAETVIEIAKHSALERYIDFKISQDNSHAMMNVDTDMSHGESKSGSPKIVNDGVTVAKEVELEDPIENIGAKLVRQAAAKTNDLAGDGTTTSVVLAQGLIAEGVKVVAAGANPVLITRGIEKTAKALVAELKLMSKEVEDSELADVAAVSAGNNYEVGNMIAEALSKVGRKGVVTLEEGKSAENSLYVVEGMQFNRGYISPYFVTDSEKMTVEFENCKLLLVDKKITNARDLINILEDAIRNGFPILIIAEDIEQEALAILVVNNFHGNFLQGCYLSTTLRTRLVFKGHRQALCCRGAHCKAWQTNYARREVHRSWVA